MYITNLIVTGAWRAADNNANQWIEADFRVIRRVISIKTRADSSTGHRVMLYNIRHSENGTDWYTFKDLFLGNVDDTWLNTNVLPGSVLARYIRLHPVQWFGSISLLWDITWCRVTGK